MSSPEESQVPDLPIPPPEDLGAYYQRPVQNLTSDNSSFQPMKLVAPIQTTLLSIIAGYLGLISVLLIFAPFALLFGILAVRDLKRRPHLDGKGRAWFGVVMGSIFTVLGLILVGSLLNRG